LLFSRNIEQLVIPSLLILFLFLVIRSAWMSDDAYITLRTVDNFVSGYGLTWNVGERVQAYTHPLWMLMLSLVHFFTNDAFIAPLALSIAIAVVAAWLLSGVLPRSRPMGIFVIISLILSKSFIDYATSGLENSLTHLLLIIFFIVYLQILTVSAEKRLFILVFLTSLIALNRPDTILLVSPAVAITYWDYFKLHEKSIRNGTIIGFLGLLPLISWGIFSLIYYGVPLPNTFYAKLNTDISTRTLARHGIEYFLVSSRVDPIMSIVIGGALISTFWRRSSTHLAIVVGILLYLSYIVKIGGDFMVGRFLTAPFLCAIVAICNSQIFTRYSRVAFPLVLLALLGLMSPRSPIWSDSNLECRISRESPLGGPLGVVDERGCYFRGTGLWQQERSAQTIPNHFLAEQGLQFQNDPATLTIFWSIGIYGFFAGPDKHIIDVNALTDPLMARLPLPKDRPWRIGHFQRFIPAGYVETLLHDENMICDPSLAEYYDKVRLLARGPIWNQERLAAIFKMNTKQYDHLLYDYIASSDAVDQLCNADYRLGLGFSDAPYLQGYSLSSSHLHAGEQLIVTLYWQGNSGHDMNLASFVSIHNKDLYADDHESQNTQWVHNEHRFPGGYSTTAYWPTQVYVDLFFIPIPENILPGDYLLEVGWLDLDSGQQLHPQTSDHESIHVFNDSSLILASLRID
jgi:arabinofuranosyltransferase